MTNPSVNPQTSIKPVNAAKLIQTEIKDGPRTPGVYALAGETPCKLLCTKPAGHPGKRAPVNKGKARPEGLRLGVGFKARSVVRAEGQAWGRDGQRKRSEPGQRLVGGSLDPRVQLGAKLASSEVKTSAGPPLGGI